MPTFELAALPQPDRQKLMVRAIAPRPIAFVSTINQEGRTNLAPFSHFALGGSSPASCVIVPTNDRHGTPKHTLTNIEATGEYVINVTTRALAERINKTSFEYPPEVDEFDVAGFTRAPSVRVRPPRVAESPINLECRLHSLVRHGAGGGAATYVIGEVLVVHADDRVCVDGMIDERLVGLAARGGGDRWVALDAENFFPLPRPTAP